ncbi:helix-turn-helix domain-containing protein [Glutamicibacter protophormiae]|uniref:helix-turn-helix domain-containing protein n=1 Tax=Glutamicibacter protophormiae TaxID=37930 RepID=UPI003A9570A0
MDIPSLLDTLGRTPSATSRATGLSRSTIYRVRDGLTSPTIETLRELALAAGYDVEVELVPASDPAAAVAARVTTDPATPALDELDDSGVADSGEVGTIHDWVARLQRQAEDDLAALLRLAGRYSAPQHRKGARFFAPKPGVSQERMIDIASSALGRRLGALSGVAAAQAYLGHAPDPGPVVAWTTDVEAVADRLAATLREVKEYQPAGVLVAPTMQAYFIDMMEPEVPGHKVVSPIQAAIDLYGLGYDGLATEITEGW